MDKIKKIIQVGSFNDDVGEWNNSDGKAYVFFEDESIAPVVLEHDDMYKAYESLGEQLGIDTSTPEGIEAIVDVVNENGLVEFCNRENTEEMEAANALLEAAKEQAKEHGGNGVGVVPTPPVNPTNEVGEGDKGETEDDVDYSEELAEPVKVNKHTGRKVLAGVLAAGAAIGAGYTVAQWLHPTTETTHDKDEDEDLDQTIDFNTASFDELMDAMDDDDVRKVATQSAMDLVETFHEETHREGNFRLEEDGETYLDLSFEEALVLTTFANYSEPEQMYEIFGTYNITSTEAQDILESARTKLITYYMNALDPSGIAEIFQSEEDRAYFQNFESEVLTFNAEHSTDASDQVIRDVYYNYILDGATNYPNVNPLAKLLAFDTVYGGLNLVESASTEHTQFLEFHGMGAEAETRYYIENILHLNYDDLTEEEVATYRTNIIESGTQLVSLMSNGETMTEDNSTAEEMAANVSVTNLVDKMGLCNAVNTEISERIQALDMMESTHASTVGQQIVVINNGISTSLRNQGLDDLADRVDQSLTTSLSDDLLSDIRAASSEAADAVANYETKMATINDTNRPTMQQIVDAANRQTALLDHFAGDSKDVATLINNRLHIEVYSYEADESGFIGYDTDDIPIFDSSVLDGMSQDEIDAFVIDNGTVINEETNQTTEEVSYDDLTEKEKEAVEEQKAVIEASLAKDNASAEGQIAANTHANSSFYAFSPNSVVNPANSEVYDLNGMTFANGVAYSQAFGGNVPSVDDAQIQNAAEVAAENYLNSFSADKQEAIANGMGTSWENAREQLKASYKAGYISQMQTEIATAISVGNEMKAATEAAMAEVAELNEQANEETNEQANEEAVEVTTESSSVEEGEVEVADEATQSQEETTVTQEENTSTQEETTVPQEETTNPNVDEEYDDNVSEHFEEGEVLIEDANGNTSEEYQEIVNNVSVPTEPIADVIIDDPVVPPIVVEGSSSTSSTGANEDDLSAAVEQAYNAALAAEAAEAESMGEEESVLVR